MAADIIIDGLTSASLMTSCNGHRRNRVTSGADIIGEAGYSLLGMTCVLLIVGYVYKSYVISGGCIY